MYVISYIIYIYTSIYSISVNSTLPPHPLIHIYIYIYIYKSL